MSSSQPKINQTSSDKHTFPSAVEAWFHGLKINWDQCLPAQVVSFDRNRNVAVVQPMIQWVLTDDTSRLRGELIEIPVLSIGGGGFHISFPLVNGSLGWIHASDRDLSLFKQTLQSSIPPISRMHSFEDGMFIPDVFRQYVIAGEDADAMVIQSVDSSTKVSISNGNIIIAAPEKVLVRTPLAEFSQDVQVDGNLTVAKNATITGNTALNGGMDATGSSGAEVTLPANATIGGITVATHGHEQQNNGSGRTAAGMIA